MYKSIVSIALFAASALGAVSFTNAPTTVEAGKSYTFTYSATGTGPVTILLKNGPSGNLQTVATITTAATGGSYTWTAPSTYPPGSYAFEIDQGTDVNYWGPVQYTGGSAAASSAVVSSAAVSSAAVSSKSAVTSSAPVSVSSGFSNSTTTASSLSTATRTGSTTGAASPTSSRVVSSNDAISFGSPVALVLSVFAAMVYLQ